MSFRLWEKDTWNTKISFTKLENKNDCTSFNISYDYDSIMNFQRHIMYGDEEIFSEVNNINPFNRMSGQRPKVSFNDLKLLNLYYSSNEYSNSNIICRNERY
uniref:Astacin domain-containing protein n=1 Tax=Parastrongyloides trichosuri TaxID=131310 RepID=A0A0N4Z5F2_PARTI